MRIEICGGIASGKTTLTKLIGQNGPNIVLEKFKTNPFWQLFYSNPHRYSFETEITFLLQHYHEIKIAEGKWQDYSCDFSFYQDLGFARMGLKNNKLRIFEDILKEGFNDVGQPDLLICLKCDPETLLKRIHKRGRKEELLLDINFLSRLNEDIYNEVIKFGKTKNVLYINSHKLNFASNKKDKKEVIHLIKSKIPF